MILKKAGEQDEKVEDHFRSYAHFVPDSLLRRAGKDGESDSHLPEYPQNGELWQQSGRYAEGRRFRHHQGQYRQLV